MRTAGIVGRRRIESELPHVKKLDEKRIGEQEQGIVDEREARPGLEARRSNC
jgi:hypothetical protein